MGSVPANADGPIVFLIDGWPAFRRSLRLFLEAAGYTVVGEAKTVGAAAESPALALADLVLLDPGRISIEAVLDIGALRSVGSRPAVVLLTAERLNPGVASEALLAGAYVQLTKLASPAELLGALAIALNGGFIVLPRSDPASVLPPLDPPEPTPLLTRREREILTLAAEGHSDSTIADILWVSGQAIKFHLANVYRKLDVRNRSAAVERAWEWGLIGE